LLKNAATSGPTFFISHSGPLCPQSLSSEITRIRQAEAMMAHDVSAPCGGSMESAAARVKAKVLVIVDEHDHMVTPQAAMDFASLLHARLCA